MLKHIFVDDLSTGAKSVESAFNISGIHILRSCCSKSREEFEVGGLESRQSEATVIEDEQTYSKASVGLSSTEDQVKILGLRWDPDSREFCFDLTEIVVLARTLPTTKLTLLKLTAKIFDPLGILSVSL